MRVLWLSPWTRPATRIYVESLIEAGADVLLVTTDRHPSSGPARPYELVLDPRPKTPSTWPEFLRALPQVHRFAPDVVVTEIVRDPRWILFGAGAPRVELVHDHEPHDSSEVRPAWERALFGWWAKRATKTVAFSPFVADAIGASAIVPLSSDLEIPDVPDFVSADGRHDIVLLGRLNDYKNIDVCLQAWRQHTAGPGWRGDNLILIGDGELTKPLPDHVVWHAGAFRYPDVISLLSHAKASVVHYRRASQSGVQVLSMQLGVTPIVSTEGALPQFQPPGEEPIGVDDVDGLARAFDVLADPREAETRGAASREHYERRYSAAVAARPLVDVLSAAATRCRRKSRYSADSSVATRNPV
jgi:glycosyltransferase involved in cell wall biosynthesis